MNRRLFACEKSSAILHSSFFILHSSFSIPPMHPYRKAAQRRVQKFVESAELPALIKRHSQPAAGKEKRRIRFISDAPFLFLFTAVSS